MSQPLLLDGFFCFSLYTGAVLLGWLGFASSLFSIIGWSMSFNNIDGFIKELNITNGKSPDDWNDDDIDFMRKMAVSIISMLIGFYVIEALASLFLIQGASNNKRLYLVPWMIERATQLIFYTVLWLSIGFYLLTSTQTIAYSLMTLIFGGVTLIFNLYCFMCVYSLFALMRDAEEYRSLINGRQQSQPPNYGNGGTTYVKI
jgi:hypothetical protein